VAFCKVPPEMKQKNQENVMRNLLLLLSLTVAAPAFAGPVLKTNKATPAKSGNGFVYESLTKVGDKYLITWPRVKVGGEIAYIDITSGNVNWDERGNALCKAFGYRSGTVSSTVIVDENIVRLDEQGSVDQFSFGYGQVHVAYGAACSNAPGKNEPRNY
jgi:hypothetical protein